MRFLASTAGDPEKLLVHLLGQTGWPYRLPVSFVRSAPMKDPVTSDRSLERSLSRGSDCMLVVVLLDALLKQQGLAAHGASNKPIQEGFATHATYPRYWQTGSSLRHSCKRRSASSIARMTWARPSPLSFSRSTCRR